MDQPEGFTSKHEEKKVCKLQRSIYGLEQASRSWNIRLMKSLKVMILAKMKMNLVCTRKKSGSAVVFLILYVDDILIFGNDIGMLTSVKLWLSKTFSMKDLGNASYIIGIKIYKDRSRN
ncbi:hypothetical protein L3X38_004459 [Prunus dulcis]|uniref:Reverse transcriptase Ty1/copia-type domain-containing protein n=1 Tax=Prunus dulcis TaxID=3755 RepID=A0AAD4ZP07_PRUDU|nr:hypothetical protein L3X38_004459 [Prunus dulcis]